MKSRYQLDSVRPSTPIELNGWNAAKMLVSNPTGSPVAIRLGGNDIPSANNYDELCAGGGYLLLPVSGASFAVGFTQPSLASSIVSSNLGTKCSVTLMSMDEVTPNFGAASFQSLSTSELLAISGFSGATQLPIQDLGAWGGALVYIDPAAGSGQGVVAILASANGVNYDPIGTFSFWPNVPAIIQVPRIARYLSVQLNSTAIPGEPAISGDVAIRATLTEVQALAYNVASQPITKTFALPGISAVQYSFVTVGLPAVSIAAIATSGTTSGAALSFLVEASADLVNWRQVTTREQSMSQGVTLYRSIGQLDLFMRVSFLQEVGGQTLNGSAYFSIPPVADLAYILNTIPQSLGDRGASSNTNQDIFHQLDSIRALAATYYPSDNAFLSNLSNINTQSNAIAIATSHLPTIDSNTAHLPAIDTNVASSNAFLTNINTQSNSIAGGTSHLPAIDTNVASSNAFLTNINTQSNSIANGTAHLPAMDTNLAALAASNARASRTPIANAFAIAAANTWTNVGALLTPGDFITFVSVGYFTPNPSNGVDVLLATGTGAGVSTLFFIGDIAEPTPTRGSNITMKYDSLRSAGFQVPAGQTNLWLQADIIGTMYLTIAVTP